MVAKNEENSDNISSNYKKPLKEHVEKLPEICFVPSNQENKPEKLTTKLTQTKAVKLHEEELIDALESRLLSNLAQKIRNKSKLAVLNQSWQFEGDFSTYPMSALLLTFMKWILLGPTTNFDINANKTLIFENLIKTITQFVSQNVKACKQSQYHIETSSKTLYSKIETPLNVGLGLYVYHIRRNKKLTNFLLDLYVGANYHKIVDIKKSFVDAVLAKNTENNGVFITSTINKENPVFFAIDNVDLTIDTPDGKRLMHGTGTVVYQPCANKKVSFVTVCK